jgi:hypothetical protein
VPTFWIFQFYADVFSFNHGAMIKPRKPRNARKECNDQPPAASTKLDPQRKMKKKNRKVEEVKEVFL